MIVGVIAVCALATVQPGHCDNRNAVAVVFPSQADSMKLPEGAPHTFSDGSLPAVCWKDTMEWIFSPENTQSPRPFVIPPGHFPQARCGKVSELLLKYGNTI